MHCWDIYKMQTIEADLVFCGRCQISKIGAEALDITCDERIAQIVAERLGVEENFRFDTTIQDVLFK